MLVGALALGCAPTNTGKRAAPSSTAERSPGALVIIGGRLEPDNHALFRAMLELRAGSGPICVIPTASADPQASLRAYVEDFERYAGPGAALGVDIAAGDTAATADPELVEQLRNCSGMFFTGGDQSRIVDTFKPGGDPSPAYLAIHERRAAGAFVAGTSAGAAMMTDPMIGGGDSAAALTHGACAHDGCPGVWIRDGMGFWSGWLTDQHFLIRGRAGRLLTALVELPDGPRLGLGVDEDTGVIVRADSAEVVGRSGALVIDAANATRTATGWSGIRMNLYGPGDRFALRDGALLEREAAPRQPDPRAPAPPAPDPAFEGWAFTEFLLALGASPNPTATTISGDGWSLIVAPGPDFSANTPSAANGVGFVGPLIVALELPPR